MSGLESGAKTVWFDGIFGRGLGDPILISSRVRAGLGSTGWTAQCLAKRRITCAADAGELGKRGRQPVKPARGHPLEVGGAGAKRTSFLNVRTPETTAAAGATRKDEDCRCTGSLASTTAHEVAAAAAVGVCRARPLALAALSYGLPVVQASGVGFHNCHLHFPATVRHAMRAELCRNAHLKVGKIGSD